SGAGTQRPLADAGVLDPQSRPAGHPHEDPQQTAGPPCRGWQTSVFPSPPDPFARRRHRLDRALLVPVAIDGCVARSGLPATSSLAPGRSPAEARQEATVLALSAASWPDHLVTLAEWQALPEDVSRRCKLV